MHSSAVCNLFSKRWSGSICEHLGVKAGFREILKYIVSSTSAKCSVTKSQRTVNEKNMICCSLSSPPHIQLWCAQHGRWITANLGSQIKTVDACRARSQKADQERRIQQKDYVIIKYMPQIKPQEKCTGFCCTFGFGYGSTPQKADPISHPLSWNRVIFMEVEIYLGITKSLIHFEIFISWETWFKWAVNKTLIIFSSS